MTTYFETPFDPNQETASAFDLIPAADYVAQLVEIGVAPTKTGSGRQLTGRFQIMEGPYENRQVYFRAMVTHTSEQAQKIGRRAIKDLCDATGIVHAMTDASGFLYKPVMIKIGIEKDKAGFYDDKNIVKRVMPLKKPDNGPAPSKPEPDSPPPSKPAPVAASPASGSPPWRR